MALDLLGSGRNVVIEWGLWTRQERDVVRDAARSIGAPVDLRYLSAEPDELWRRISRRDEEGAWRARSIRRDELDDWVRTFEPPSDAELTTYEYPTEHGPA